MENEIGTNRDVGDKPKRERKHIQIHSAVKSLSILEGKVDRLLADIKGDEPALIHHEKDISAAAPIASLGCVLENTAGLINDSRVRIEKQIEELKELLF